MNQDIENIIKKNLPEERTQDNLPFENSPEIYGNQRIEAYKNGFNQALSQINPSLIADEVLKVVVDTRVEIIKKLQEIRREILKNDPYIANKLENIIIELNK